MKSLGSAYNILLGLVVAASLGACSDATGVDGEMHASLTVLREQQVSYSNAGSILPFTPTLSVSKGEVGILGQIRTPTPCYALKTNLLSANNVITLTVTAESQTQGVCAQVLVVRDYGAAIRNIPAGQYTVRVVHIIDTFSRDPDIVLEQQVSVP